MRGRSPRNIDEGLNRRSTQFLYVIPPLFATRAFPFLLASLSARAIGRDSSNRQREPPRDLLTKRSKVFQLAFLSYIIHKSDAQKRPTTNDESETLRRGRMNIARFDEKFSNIQKSWKLEPHPDGYRFKVAYSIKINRKKAIFRETVSYALFFLTIAFT